MYNKIEVMNMKKRVKEVNRTTTKKAEHYCKIEELRKLLYDCMNINPYLFDPDSEYHFQNYKKAYYMKDTKKNLDHLLYLCLYHLYSELHEIGIIVDTMDYDEQKQCYIERTT